MTRSASRDPDWVGLSEASRVLGVSPATLRRWSDAGRLRVFTTPGGHRRFSRSALERLLPADRSRRPSIGGAGLSPSRIARTYRRASREAAPELPWVLTLSDEQRLLFRERGHVLAASLLQYLDATQPEAAAHHLEGGVRLGRRVRHRRGDTRTVAQPDGRGLPPFPRAVPSRAGGRGPPARVRYGRDDRPARDRRAGDGPAAGGHDDGPHPGRRQGRSTPPDRGADRRGSRGVNGAPSVPIVALVTHARHVPAIERERFAAALHRELAGRAFMLETCHRVEAYLGNADDAARLAAALPAGGRALTGEHAVHHAMTVAVGRDSVVVGEDQILHQLRASVDAARAAGTLDPALERLFALALQAGRRARSWRQGPATLARRCRPCVDRAAGGRDPGS